MCGLAGILALNSSGNASAKAVEAMAAALPIVATSVGDVPRVVDERCGRLVEPSRPEELAEVMAKLSAA